MRVCSLCQRCYNDLVDRCTEESHPPLGETRVGSCDIVPGYSLEFLLDGGGNAEIYRARHTRSGQSCFIKIVEANDEYRDAVDIATSFFHPAVAAVYDIGILHGDEEYIVTEDAAKQTLRDSLDRDGVPSLIKAVRIARQAAEALNALHTGGLTHGAINPANLALETDASIKVQNLDLGGVCSRSIASERVLNASGLYSLRYYSPEQCSGEMPDARSDIYSLGVVLYEMLAGRPPFEGHTAAALIDGHRNQTPPDLRIDNFDLRMLLTHTVTESLQKQPSRRQASASAFARQLRQIEQLATHAPTPPAAGEVQMPVAVASVQPVVVVQPIKKVELLIDREKPEPIPFRPEAGSIASSLGYDPVPVRANSSRHPDGKAKLTAEPSPAVDLDDLDDPISTTVESLQAVSYPPSRQPRPSPLSLIKRRFAETLAQLGSVFTKSASDPASQIKPIQFRAVAAQIPDLLAERERLTNAGVLQKEPKKVAWEPLEDDIPLETDAVGTLVEHEIAPIEEMPIPKPIAVFATSAAEVPSDVPVEGHAPMEAEATVTPETAVHYSEQRSRLKRIRKRSHKRTASTVKIDQQNISWPAVIEDAPDPEIVHVRHIEWNRPEIELRSAAGEGTVPEQVVALGPEVIALNRVPDRHSEVACELPSDTHGRPAPEIAFVPTLLGKKGHALQDLTRYQAGRRRGYRSAAAVGGIAALIAFYVFAGDLVGKYIPAWNAGDPPIARTAPQLKTPKRVAPVDLRVLPGKTPAKTTQKPSEDDQVQVIEPDPPPTPAKVKVPAPNQVSHITAVKARMPKPTISKLVPTTLVIYSDNGTIRTRTEPAKTDRNITDGRPRTVKDPFR